jgi:signal transduction histidine kinase
MWLSLADGLAALRALGSELQRRTLQDLSTMDPRRWPRDLVPLIHTTNQLFQRLSSAYQQERRFVDHAAHQLRTPIATIKLQSQLIARETNEAERRKLVSELEASANRAADLNDRLLTLARLEAEVGSAGEADLGPETTAVLADLAPFAQSRGVTLAYEGASARVRGDPALLRLIASNLVDNAIRHAPDGSEVEVRVESDPAAACLTVLDGGPGIPLAERAHVFERFYRAPGEAPGGTGLGLSIVAEAVRVLGGAIALVDRPDGRSGLCACVTIPRSVASAG